MEPMWRLTVLLIVVLLLTATAKPMQPHMPTKFLMTLSVSNYGRYMGNYTLLYDNDIKLGIEQHHNGDLATAFFCRGSSLSQYSLTWYRSGLYCTLAGYPGIWHSACSNWTDAINDYALSGGASLHVGFNLPQYKGQKTCPKPASGLCNVWKVEGQMGENVPCGTGDVAEWYFKAPKGNTTVSDFDPVAFVNGYGVVEDDAPDCVSRPATVNTFAAGNWVIDGMTAAQMLDHLRHICPK
eukprot:TRINITY_DN67638_c8_g1_i2.p1 TRINITY_DN67638_c8_g1~~TRINITY_DN67638_c8_g1_i2.p1  ORF type:complete len:239 (+),score=22.47 TRINITY_DN67638_c8_g1_i2:28-744(+)